MSVLIKGMEMPKDCRICPFEGYEPDIGRTRCIVTCRLLAEHYKPIPFDGRPDWCPLVELPEKHGRLIDEDEIHFCMTNGIDQGIAEEAIMEASTVIEAEGEE